MWLAVMLASFSCLPFPHYQQRRPEIYGRVQSDEQPAPNLPVTVRSEDVDADACTTTASDGTFYFPAKKEFQFLFWFGDRLDQWKVCIEPPSGEPVCSERRAYWGGTKVEVLSCELTKRTEEVCQESPTQPAVPAAGNSSLSR